MRLEAPLQQVPVFALIFLLSACGVDGSGLSPKQPLAKDASTMTRVGGDAAVPAEGTGGNAVAPGGTTGAGMGFQASGGAVGSGSGGAPSAGSGGNRMTGGGAAGGDPGPAPGSAGAGNGSGASGSGGPSGTGGRGAGGGVIAGAGGSAAAAGGSGGTTALCSPATCPDGCCDHNRCVTQRSIDFCGSGGGACTVCGGCQVCGPGGICAIDPSSRWTIVCGSAQLSMTAPFVGSWDGPGEVGNRNPDPFCEFETVAGVVSDTGAGVTGTVRDSFTADWNETVSPPGITISGATLLSPTARWRLWVGDDDGCNAGGCFGDLACEVDAPMQTTWLQSGEFTLTNVGSCVSLTVKLICQP